MSRFDTAVYGLFASLEGQSSYEFDDIFGDDGGLIDSQIHLIQVQEENVDDLGRGSKPAKIIVLTNAGIHVINFTHGLFARKRFIFYIDDRGVVI